MARVTVEDCVDKIPNRFDLVLTAAFRARQQAFDRDRNEYCNAMMAKARASAEKAATIGSQQPPKV